VGKREAMNYKALFYLYLLIPFTIQAAESALEKRATTKIPYSQQTAASLVHKAVITSNDMQLGEHLKSFGGVKAANCMHKGQRPLHVVTSILCAELLLTKADPTKPNKKGETPLRYQTSKFLILYDTANTATKEQLVERHFHQKTIIGLLAKKHTQKEKKQIFKKWARILYYYQRFGRLRDFSSSAKGCPKTNKAQYYTMMQDLLGLEPDEE
jgi:hypothetical protein